MDFIAPKRLESQAQKVGGIAQKVDYFKNGDGIWVWKNGLKYPSKGIPYAEAEVAVNGVKTMMVMWIFSFNPFTWERTLNKFVSGAHELLAPHILEDNFLSKENHHVLNLLLRLGDRKLAEIIAWVFEYDSAYSLIKGDAVSETTTDRLLKRPLRETWRVLSIVEDRILSHKKTKYRMLKLILALALCSPRVRRSFRKVVSMGIEAIGTDEINYYHCLYQTYYNFFGRTYQDRRSEFNRINAQA